MHNLLWLALVLIVAWIVLRFALVVTSAALHIIWIIAVVMFILWLIRLMRGGGRPAA